MSKIKLKELLGIEAVLSVDFDKDTRNLTTVKLLVEDWSHPKWVALQKLLIKEKS